MVVSLKKSKYHTITDNLLLAVGTLLIGLAGINVRLPTRNPTWQVKGEEPFPRTS